MKKLNKFILGAASVAAVAAPIATVISCGSAKLTDEEMLKLTPQSVEKSSTVLVTDGGSIQDKSFNEQAADALKAIRGVNDLDASMFNQPNSHDAGAILQGYEAMASRGAKTVLAPGFYHTDAITSFVKSHKNAMNFILVDGVVKAGNVASITFNTKQPGFLAGYTAAKYVNDKNLAHKVGTFGGGNFPGVTDFMAGFVAGVKFWNEANSTDATKKVTFARLGTDGAYTGTGFNAGGGTTTAQTLINDGASIILPVAGPQTADVIAAIKTAHKENLVKVIGVDTDQSLSYSTDASFFLTSIMKNISTAFKEVYKKVTNETVADSIKGFGETTNGDLKNQLVGIAPAQSSDAEATAARAEALTHEADATADAVNNYTWTEALAYIKAN